MTQRKFRTSENALKAKFAELPFYALGCIEKGPMRSDHREPVHQTWLVAVLWPSSF
jgi:hypothetical protein